MTQRRTKVTHITGQQGRAELEAIYAEHPVLREHRRHCCGGCAEGGLADTFGWGSPIIGAWRRVETLRFLLEDE